MWTNRAALATDGRSRVTQNRTKVSRQSMRKLIKFKCIKKIFTNMHVGRWNNNGAIISALNTYWRYKAHCMRLSRIKVTQIYYKLCCAVGDAKTRKIGQCIIKLMGAFVLWHKSSIDELDRMCSIVAWNCARHGAQRIPLHPRIFAILINMTCSMLKRLWDTVMLCIRPSDVCALGPNRRPPNYSRCGKWI